MHKLFSTFLMTLFVGVLFSQKSTLSGTILDSNTEEPLIGVTVRVGNTGAVTDIDGRFSLQLNPGTHELEASYVGYTSMTKKVRLEEGGTELNLLLTDDSNLLNQATITSGKFEKPLGEVTVSLEVIKPKFIENNNSNSINDALDRVPGVNIIDGQANIRGGSGFSYGAGSRVLLLLNDLPALQVDAGFPNWNDFPVENIGQVEVLKGAASALFGSAAMNGIINVRTGYAKGKPETEVAVFGTMYDSPKDERKKWWGTDSTIAQPYEVGLNFVHRRKAGKWDIVLGGFATDKKDTNEKTFAQYARLTPNLRYRINDRLSVGINANFNAGKSGDFFLWANDSTGAFRPGPGAARQNNGRFRHVIDPFVHYFDKHGNRHKLLGRFYTITNQNDNNQGNFSRTYYGEYQFQRHFSDINLVMTAGLNATRSKIEAELYSNGNFTVNNQAAYLQLDQKLFDRLNLSAGLRYERNQQISPETVSGFVVPDPRKVEAKPVLRLGANYQVGKATFFRASWGQGYRFPTVAEKFITTAFGGSNFVIPSTDLVSETGWSAELGVKQGFKLGDWKGFTDVAFFNSEYTDMMEFVLDSLEIKFTPTGIVANTFFRSKNVGDTRISGIEYSVLGQGPIGNGDLALWAGYTYIDPQFREFGEFQMQTSSRPDKNVLKYRYRHTAKADVEYTLGKWSIGSNVNYFSFMEAIDLAFEQALPGVGNYRKNNMHGTTVVDARIGFQATPQLKARFLCSNLLNEEIPVRPALLGPTRGFTVRLEYKI